MNLSSIRFIDDPSFDAKGKRVLVRVDFNVPLKDGAVSNDKRIRASLPTIQHLIAAGARVVLASHLGRPKGEAKPELSLKPIAAALAGLLGQDVSFCATCIGPEAEDASAGLQDGEVLLLENLRFHAEETKGDAAFAAELAKHAEIFVNDAFGTCHRAHASVSGVAELLPAFAGLLIRREVEAFGPLMTDAPRPFVALLGGAKVSDKIRVIESLLERADALIIGGGMAYTFLKAQGEEIGTSLLDSESLEFAKEMLVRAESNGVAIHLPIDHVIADDFDGTNAKPVKEIPADKGAFDIGNESAIRFGAVIEQAKSVIFNGPMGVFENPKFVGGTRAVLEAMSNAKDRGALVVVGGGDSAAATESLGFSDKVSHISTGGGASLELLEGKALPGLVALQAD